MTGRQLEVWTPWSACWSLTFTRSLHRTNTVASSIDPSLYLARGRTRGQGGRVSTQLQTHESCFSSLQGSRATPSRPARRVVPKSLTRRSMDFPPKQPSFSRLLLLEGWVTVLMDDETDVDVVYIVFVSAFDSVKHRLLGCKL